MNEVIRYFTSVSPREAAITKIEFEGIRLAIYTKNPDLFIEQDQVARELVTLIKKRVVIRSDPSIRKSQEEATELIKPKISSNSNLFFDETLGEAIIETNDMTINMSDSDETTMEIMKLTGWKPRVVRSPLMNSKIFERLRNYVYWDPREKLEILRNIGERIFRAQTFATGDVTVTFLGAARQVGRSAILVETSESRLLLDCGLAPGASSSIDMFPRFDSRIDEIMNLDAVVISHAHLDHMGVLPFLFKYGYRGPVFLLEPTLALMTMEQLDYISVAGKEGSFSPFSEQEVRTQIQHSIPLRYGTVSNITPDIRITLYNAGHILGSSIVHLHVGEGLHNIVYSLDWSTPVVVIDPHGATRIIEIGRLIDDIMGRFEPTGDYVQRVGNFEGWKTIAFDPKTYEIREVPITSFLRHPISEELYEITTTSGKKAAVSGSHSVFKAEDGRIFTAPVRNLKPHDYVISARTVPLIREAYPVVDLPEDEFRVYLNDPVELVSTLDRYEKLLQGSLPLNKEEVLLWLRERFGRAEYRSNIAQMYDAKQARVARVFKLLDVRDLPRRRAVLPKKFSVTPDFARFIGYYLAEGSVNGNTVVITNDSQAILRYCEKIIAPIFGCKPFKRNGEIRFPSKSLRQLLSRLGCGENAYTKRVPPILLSAPESVITELLRGYLEGDGSLRARDTGWSISAGSKSRLLVEDFAFLMLRLSIPVTYEHNSSTKMHYINVHGLDLIQKFLDKVRIPMWLRKAKNARRLIHKSAFCDRVPIKTLPLSIQERITRTAYRNAKSIGISQLQLVASQVGGQSVLELDQPFIYEEIKSIVKVKPTSKFVYDLSVDGFENFLGGHGFLFMHNTGDYKFERSRTLEPSVYKFPRAETLIMEATYGANPVPFTRVESEAILAGFVKQAVERGGKILIPVAAIGRAQEIMLVLKALFEQKIIPEVPVFLDGLLIEATSLHTAYPEYLAQDLTTAFEQNVNAFASDIFTPVKNQTQRDEILNSQGPAVIMSTSGMLEGGPILGYIKEFADDEKNMLIFVMYQVEGTMGRKLLKGIREIPLANSEGKTEIVQIKLQVERVDGFSGHSSRQQLLNYLRRFTPKPRNLVLIHGEPEAIDSLAKTASRIIPSRIYAPRCLDSLSLTG